MCSALVFCSIIISLLLLVTRIQGYIPPTFFCQSQELFDRRRLLSPRQISQSAVQRKLRLQMCSEPQSADSLSPSPDITPALIKTLRERTGAGFTTCKAALIDSKGDINAAVELMRKQGTAIALKKGLRSTLKGLIGVAVSDDQRSGSILEIACETDFVTRNDIYLNLVTTVAKAIANSDYAETAVDMNWLNTLPIANPSDNSIMTAHDQLIQAIATVGENMAINRPAKLCVSKGIVGSYVHNSFRENTGKIGVLVALHCEVENRDILAPIAKTLSLQIAAQNPEGLTIESIPPELVQKERNIIEHQATEANIAANRLQAYTDGKLRKYFEQVCLMEQKLAMENSKTVRKFLQDMGGTIGSPITIAGFRRYALGD